MTIAEAARRLVIETSEGIPRDLWHVAYGDCFLLDRIGILAGMKRCHPLDRHKRILDALGRSPLFEKRYFKAGYRLARMFYLKESEKESESESAESRGGASK